MAISTIGTDALASAAVTSAKLASGAPSRSQLPAGTVLQVVQGTYATEVTSSSSTLADTGLTATITPSSATSKILVFVDQTGCLKATNNTFLFLALLRAGSIIAHIERVGGSTNSTSQTGFGSCSISYLDSPATTSSVTYKTQFASSGNNGTVYLQSSSSNIPSTSTITLMEIAA